MAVLASSTHNFHLCISEFNCLLFTGRVQPFRILLQWNVKRTRAPRKVVLLTLTLKQYQGLDSHTRLTSIRARTPYQALGKRWESSRPPPSFQALTCLVLQYLTYARITFTKESYFCHQTSPFHIPMVTNRPLDTENWKSGKKEADPTPPPPSPPSP